MYKIQIILGSTREGRVSEKIGKWVLEQAKKRTDFEVELLDLRDYPLPFFEEAITPDAIKGNYKSDVAKLWSAKIRQGDGYIIIAPEYNHGYPAVLKNALDYLYEEWNNKPVAFVSYGGVGGARSVEQLRQVVIQLQMVPISSAVPIQEVWNAFDEAGNPKDEKLNMRVSNLFEKLMWWTKALKSARDQK